MQLLIEQLVNGRITRPGGGRRALSCRFMCGRRTSAEYLHFANRKVWAGSALGGESITRPKTCPIKERCGWGIRSLLTQSLSVVTSANMVGAQQTTAAKRRSDSRPNFYGQTWAQGQQPPGACPLPLEPGIPLPGPLKGFWAVGLAAGASPPQRLGAERAALDGGSLRRLYFLLALLHRIDFSRASANDVRVCCCACTTLSLSPPVPKVCTTSRFLPHSPAPGTRYCAK